MKNRQAIVRLQKNFSSLSLMIISENLHCRRHGLPAASYCQASLTATIYLSERFVGLSGVEVQANYNPTLRLRSGRQKLYYLRILFTSSKKCFSLDSSSMPAVRTPLQRSIPYGRTCSNASRTFAGLIPPAR